MTPHDANLDPELEQAIDAIRGESIDQAAMEAAGRRVWARLEQHSTLHGCADFQALIPEYRAGRLPEARALLLKDHTHECVACRKALEAASGKVTAMPAPRARKPLFRGYGWAVAAGLTVAAGLGVWMFGDQFLPMRSGREGVVEAADGLVYRVTDTGNVPLARGAEVPAGALIRTARDTGAMVRLRDGSRVEMRERSGFSVAEHGKDMTIALERGAIIVEAAKRHAGHLYVSTRDCRVAVTGTVFSVNSGVKGSRVTVIEGTVLVAQDRHETVLRAGQQVATSQAMGRVPVRKEIAWSHNLDAHIAMLNAVTALNASLEAAQYPPLRYASNLLQLVPAQTVVYASIPNLNEALTEVQQVFRPKLTENAELSQWWQQNKLDQVIGDMSAMSTYLGNEMVVAASLNASGHPGAPVILAELKQPGFQEFAQAELAKIGTGGNSPKVRIATDAGSIGSIPQGQCVLLILPGLVALSPDAAMLGQIAAGAPSTFSSTEFGQQIIAAYGSGVGLLFAADTQAMTAASHEHMMNMHYLMVQQTGNGGVAETRASVIFEGTRTGVASWLAAPAPLGGLDFISPDATLVWAAAVKQPSAIIDELAVMQPEFAQHLAGVEALIGVDLRNDLAAALGGEFTMAQDGPLLPMPSWKVAIEVYDPVKLQATFQKLVAVANKTAPNLQLQQFAANGRTYYTLSGAVGKMAASIVYTYTDGYLVAAPNQALLDSSIQNRANGYTLTRSAAFTALVPRDEYANFSAVGYLNAGSKLASLVEQFNPGTSVNGSQQQALGQIAANLKPTLVALYGEPDRITFASNGSLFGLTFGNMSLLHMLQMPGTQGH